MSPTNLILFFITFYIKYSASIYIDTNTIVDNNVNQSVPEDVGQPLILTPYLEQRMFELARKKAVVEHSEIPGIESYSGFLTVNKKYNSNLFFWYFPAEVKKTILYF